MQSYLYDSLKNRKKRIMLRLVAASMLLAGLIFMPVQSVFAATPTVKYDGKSASVTFENVSGTDLFGGFKGLMPGDEREQDILLKAKPAGREASFYLKAECDDETRELLKDVTMNLYIDHKPVLENGVIFNQIKLGTIGNKGELPLKAAIKIPLSLGNEVAGKELHIKWTITVQEDGKEIASGTFPENGSEAGSARTGDRNKNISQIFFMMSIAAGVIFALLVIKRRSKISKYS